MYRIIHARNVDKTVLIVQRINAIHVKMAIFYREIHVRNVQWQTVRNVKKIYALLVKKDIFYRIKHARNVDKTVLIVQRINAINVNMAIFYW